MLQRPGWLWCYLVMTSVAAAAEVTLAPGEPLTPRLVADLVRGDLVARGLDDGLTVEVAVPGAPLPNRAATPTHVALAELQYEPNTGRFRAQLRASLQSGEASTLPISGRVVELVEVTVPARAIARGETIGEQDLTSVQLASAEVRADTLRRPAELIGLQAARALPAGRPARSGDVAAPVLVRRGEPASMRFIRGGLEIVGAGIALDQGRHGNSVRVQNAGSGELRRAIVIGPREVAVKSVMSRP